MLCHFRGCFDCGPFWGSHLFREKRARTKKGLRAAERLSVGNAAPAPAPAPASAPAAAPAAAPAPAPSAAATLASATSAATLAPSAAVPAAGPAPPRLCSGFERVGGVERGTADLAVVHPNVWPPLIEVHLEHDIPDSFTLDDDVFSIVSQQQTAATGTNVVLTAREVSRTQTRSLKFRSQLDATVEGELIVRVYQSETGGCARAESSDGVLLGVFYADSNLENELVAQVEDLRRTLHAGVTAVILLDRLHGDVNGIDAQLAIKDCDGEAYPGTPTGSMLLQVRSNEIVLLRRYAELDMDDSGILTTFLHEQLEAHKGAKWRALVFSAHGAGLHGVGGDDHSDTLAPVTQETVTAIRGALAGAAAAHAVNWNLGLGGAVASNGALTIFEGDTLSLLWTSGHDVHRIDGPCPQDKSEFMDDPSRSMLYEQHPGGTGSVFDVTPAGTGTFCFACTPHFTDMKFSVTVKRRIDAVAFDACTMAHLAVADALALPKPVSNFLFASEDLVPAAGWKYVPMSDADVTTADNFFARIADASIVHFSRARLTYSLIDLQKYQDTFSTTALAFFRRLAAFVTHADANVALDHVTAARQEATSFGVGSASYEADAFNVADDDVYVSLGEFLTKFEERVGCDALKTETQNLRTQLGAVVSQTWASTGVFSGLALYFPMHHTDLSLLLVQSGVSVHDGLGTDARVFFLHAFYHNFHVGGCASDVYCPDLTRPTASSTTGGATVRPADPPTCANAFAGTKRTPQEAAPPPDSGRSPTFGARSSAAFARRPKRWAALTPHHPLARARPI